MSDVHWVNTANAGDVKKAKDTINIFFIVFPFFVFFGPGCCVSLRAQRTAKTDGNPVIIKVFGKAKLHYYDWILTLAGLAQDDTARKGYVKIPEN